MGTTLVLAHGLWYGGGQVSTLEFLRLLKKELRDLHVAVCIHANPDFVYDIQRLGMTISRVPYRLVDGYPDMAVDKIRDVVRKADVVWISDREHLSAPKIKSIKDVPVTAHIRSYALICNRMRASCGLSETCLQPCTVLHLTKCKQLMNEELRKVGILSAQRSRIYKILDLGKGPLDYFRWPLRNKGVIDSIDGFISVSKATLEIHERHAPQLKNKTCEVIYNPPGVPVDIVKRSLEGRDSPLGKKKDGPLIVTYVDRSAELTKGPHVFVQALGILKNRGLRIEANMLGCKDTWVERYAKKLHVNNITFRDRLPRNEVYELMCDSSLVVVPSLWPEPFGRVAAEANYLGVPVVASRIGGLPEIIEDGKTGLLASPGRPEDFAEKIEESMKADFQRDYIHELTREKFNPDTLVGKLVSFFRRLSPSL